MAIIPSYSPANPGPLFNDSGALVVLPSTANLEANPPKLETPGSTPSEAGFLSDLPWWVWAGVAVAVLYHYEKGGLS